MPDFKPWDVVKVPFPYTDRPVQQRRPPLVLATHQAGGAKLLWVLMITSAANRAWPGDIPIEDLAAAGLPAPSILRTAKVATIEAAVADPVDVMNTGPVRALVAGNVLDRLAALVGAQ
jgi:mRNA interferase MazF